MENGSSNKKKASKNFLFGRLRTRFVADYHRSRAVMVIIYEHKVKVFFQLKEYYHGRF